MGGELDGLGVGVDDRWKELGVLSGEIKEGFFSVWGVELTLSMLHQKIINKVSRGPPCEDGNARFTVVLFKASSDQVWIINPCL